MFPRVHDFMYYKPVVGGMLSIIDLIYPKFTHHVGRWFAILQHLEPWTYMFCCSYAALYVHITCMY